MEIELKEFVKLVYADKEDHTLKEQALGLLLKGLVFTSGKQKELIPLKHEAEYIQLKIPLKVTDDIITEMVDFSEALDFAYNIENTAENTGLLLNFYKVKTEHFFSHIIVDVGDFSKESLRLIAELLRKDMDNARIYAQLEGYYSAMEKFMFMVEGLRSYKMVEVEKFLQDQLAQICEFDKFAIYISSLDNTEMLTLLSYFPQELHGSLPKSLKIDDLDSFSDFYIMDLETNNIIGYLLYRPKAYANLDDDFLYLVNYLISKSIENSVLFEEKKFLAERDPLTGVYNRRYLFEALKNVVYNAVRYYQDFGFIMFDIDDFKKINDRFGHMVGDRVLREIGKVLKLSTRQTDVAGRYGGEEFGLICVGAGLPQCYGLAERIRKEIENLDFSDVSKELKVTVSVGVATYSIIKDLDGDPLDNIIKWADKALYKAKATGKNRVVVCDELIKEQKLKSNE